MGYSKKSDLFSVGGLRLGGPEKMTKNVFKNKTGSGHFISFGPSVNWLASKQKASHRRMKGLSKEELRRVFNQKIGPKSSMQHGHLARFGGHRRAVIHLDEIKVKAA